MLGDRHRGGSIDDDDEDSSNSISRQLAQANQQPLGSSIGSTDEGEDFLRVALVGSDELDDHDNSMSSHQLLGSSEEYEYGLSEPLNSPHGLTEPLDNPHELSEPLSSPTTSIPIFPKVCLCIWDGCTDRQTFASTEDLVRHVNEEHICHEHTQKYVCEWRNCVRKGKSFDARYKIVIHMRTHTKEKPHVCPLRECSAAFSRIENLKIHIRSHTGERPYMCQEEGCGKTFANSSDRFKHKRTHSEKTPFHCPVSGCNKSYTDPSSLRKHNKKAHDPDIVTKTSASKPTFIAPKPSPSSTFNAPKPVNILASDLHKLSPVMFTADSRMELQLQQIFSHSGASSSSLMTSSHPSLHFMTSPTSPDERIYPTSTNPPTMLTKDELERPLPLFLA